jgi:hypothetical protein
MPFLVLATDPRDPYPPTMRVETALGPVHAECLGREILRFSALGPCLRVGGLKCRVVTAVMRLAPDGRWVSRLEAPDEPWFEVSAVVDESAGRIAWGQVRKIAVLRAVQSALDEAARELAAGRPDWILAGERARLGKSLDLARERQREAGQALRAADAELEAAAAAFERIEAEIKSLGQASAPGPSGP